MHKIILKAFAGLFMLIVGIACVLFIPAGSFSYWQGWVFVLTFFISVLLITIYLMKNDPELLKRRVKAGPIAEQEVSQKIIQSIAQLAFLFVFILPALDFRFHWSSVPPLFSLIGDGIVVLGLFIVFLVFKENTYTAATIAVDKGQEVISTGPYRYVRHPMYSGAMVMLLGVPPALGSWWGMFALIPLFLLIVVRLLDEERYLLIHLKGYKEYCHKTQFHLLPYIW